MKNDIDYLQQLVYGLSQAMGSKRLSKALGYCSHSSGRAIKNGNLAIERIPLRRVRNAELHAEGRTYHSDRLAAHAEKALEQLTPTDIADHSEFSYSRSWKMKNKSTVHQLTLQNLRAIDRAIRAK